MGGAQAARVMRIVAEGKLTRGGATINQATQQVLDEHAQAIEARLDATSEALYCSARLFDDGIINLRDSRSVLLLALETCLAARQSRAAC
jgi:geranyl-CoA carboxylase beta subunit